MSLLEGSDGKSRSHSHSARRLVPLKRPRIEPIAVSEEDGPLSPSATAAASTTVSSLCGSRVVESSGVSPTDLLRLTQLKQTVHRAACTATNTPPSSSHSPPSRSSSSSFSSTPSSLTPTQQLQLTLLHMNSSKLLPEVPFGKRTTGVGNGGALPKSVLSSVSKGVQIMGVFLSKKALHVSSPVAERLSPPSTSSELGPSCVENRGDEDGKHSPHHRPAVLVTMPSTSEEELMSRLYVRLLIDRSLEMTLPWSVVMEQYAPLLIDYCLSMALYI